MPSQSDVPSSIPSESPSFFDSSGFEFTLTGLPRATLSVELRIFIRGDYDGGSEEEHAHFFFLNNTSGTAFPLIGRFMGPMMTQCRTEFLRESFVIPVSTYNAFHEEGNGTVFIVVDVGKDVGNFCFQNDAYIQFIIDGGCGL